MSMNIVEDFLSCFHYDDWHYSTDGEMGLHIGDKGRLVSNDYEDNLDYGDEYRFVIVIEEGTGFPVLKMHDGRNYSIVQSYIDNYRLILEERAEKED
jgi:hypothetical protein